MRRFCKSRSILLEPTIWTLLLYLSESISSIGEWMWLGGNFLLYVSKVPDTDAILATTRSWYVSRTVSWACSYPQLPFSIFTRSACNVWENPLSLLSISAFILTSLEYPWMRIREHYVVPRCEVQISHKNLDSLLLEQPLSKIVKGDNIGGEIERQLLFLRWGMLQSSNAWYITFSPFAFD